MADELFTPDSRRLELVGAARNLRVTALAGPAPAAGRYRWPAETPLYAVRFAGAPARVDADADRLRLRFRHSWLWPFAGTRQTDLALHPHVRWRLAVRGGLARSRLDLAHLHVDGVEVHGGLDELELRLPQPAAELPVAIRGGVRRLRLVCPPGAALRLRIDGGVDRLQVDTLRIGSLGGRFAWETPGWADHPRRVDIRLRGGVSDLAVDWPADPLSLLDPFAPTRIAAWPRLFGDL